MNRNRLQVGTREPTKMENVLLSIIAASGLCAVSSPVERRYHFVNEPKTMPEAASYCRDKDWYLATVHSTQDVEVLNNMADLSRTKIAWIGLYSDMNSWSWSLADHRFYRDEEAEFRNWGFGQPDNFRSAEYCVNFMNGLWYNRPCVSLLSSVCADVRGSNVTFVLVRNSMTWTEAQSYCREHHTDLASVRNVAENRQVKQLVPTGHKVWISLFRDSWKWLDGSDSSFRFWNQGSGKPKNNRKRKACVLADFSLSGEWTDSDCNLRRAFICHSVGLVSKKQLKVRLVKKSSSLDLNDPAVMEDILKQLQQMQKDRGVREDIRLSWRKQPDGKVFHQDEKETNKRKTLTTKDQL